MKTLNAYINETLKLSRSEYINEWRYHGNNVDDKNTVQAIKYREHPKTKEELNNIIEKRLKENNENPYLLDIDVSAIENMEHLFSGDTESELYDKDLVSKIKRLDLSSWNTKSLKKCNHMFYMCFNVEEIIFSGLFNTSKVETMMSMFADCESLRTLDLSMFNVDNVKTVRAMFHSCRKLKEIKGIEKWDLDSMENDYMFNGCDDLKYNYYDKHK